MEKPSPSEKEIFAEALRLSTPEERAACLKNACGDDAQLRQRIEALFEAHDQVGEFLQQPAVGVSPKTLVITTGTVPVTEKPGDRIGHYKLREKVGEGGCGVVYVAEQEKPVRRRVALKVIKLGMDSKSVVARFEAERQALAMMDHPNIAKVLDAGTTDTGRPYFVMELVRGIKITDYCDQNNLSTGDRLDLFVKVCHAIQHAHQKGIIHRDLKPSNILVTLHDGVPVPKVIDFGIAKATEGRLTELTVYTELHQFIGTPAYISPEQAEMSGLDIDTRADIYSLGVLLYELLTGKTPFSSEELLRAGFDEMRRTIREKEPVRPSTRLSTMLEGELTVTAKRHGADAPKLIHLIRGDLDWIVMKSLEKDRTRRYETANGLAMDIKRHLSNEPVVARPPSAAYRFQKLVRRNKLAFAAAAAVAVALVFGVVASTWQAVRAGRAEQAATLERNRAEQAAQLASQEASRANREATAASSARQLAEGRLVRMNVAEGWRRVADGDLFGALTPLTEALQLEENDPPRAEAHRLRLACVLRQCPKLVHVWSVGGQLTRAELSRDDGRILTATTLSTNQAVAQIWDAATGRPLTPPMEHTNAISSLAWSADGSRVVTASADQTARVWDAATGRPISAPLRHDAPVAGARFNANAARVLTVSLEAWRRGQGTQPQVTLWEVASGQAIWRVPGGDNFGMSGASGVCFSPDERLVVAETEILDAKTGQVLNKLPNCQMPHHLEFSPDGKRALLTGHFAGTNEESARILDGQDLSRVLAITPAPDHPLFGRFSPDGARIATFTDYNFLRLWDAGTGLAVTAPLAQRGLVNSISFSPDGRHVATACSDQTARVWDATTGTAVTPPLPHGGPVQMVAFSADGLRLFTASEDGTVAVWDLRAAVPRFTWALSRYGGNRVAVSPDGQLAMAPSFGDKTLRVWNLANGELALPPLFTEAGVWEVNFSADGRKLLTSGFSAQVWDVTTGKPLSLPLSLPVVEDGAPVFSRDGQRVVSSSWKTNDVRVWNAATGELIARLNTDSPVGRAEFSADGKQVVAAATNGTVFVWRLPAGEPALRFPAGDVARAAKFSADGRRIATAAGKQARVWDARSGQPVTPPLRHANDVYSAEFSPDGRWVLTGGRGSGFRIWNSTNGQPFAGLLHRGSIRAASFSEDGKLLATATPDKAVRVWDVATGDPVTPPLAHPGEVFAAKFTPDGRRLLTSSSVGSETSVRVWELPMDNRSVADWAQLAQFFGGSRVSFEAPPSGGGESASREHSESSRAVPGEVGTPTDSRTNSIPFPETWLALRQKHPSDFSIAETELDAWERHAAAHAEERSDWPAAVQHLTRLLQTHPDSGDFLPRRASAYARWAGAAGTPADPERMQSALTDYTRAIASIELHREIAKQSRKPLLVERSKVLRQLNRLQEAQADLLEAKDIPPRSADAGPHLVDLTPWYNAGFNDSSLTFSDTGADFSALAPAGIRKLATGVEFDVRGLIMLDSQLSFPPGEHPGSVTGLKIARPCRRLHFLQATGTTRDVAGTAVAKIVLHIANGETRTLDLKLGDDLWNYTFESGKSKLTKNSRVAWTGPANPRHPDGPQAQLFQTTWENPSPDIAVESIEYVSAMNDPVPFLIAITTEP